MKPKFTMTTKLLSMAVLSIVFLSLSMGLQAEDPPLGAIMKADGAPAIDGNADDPMWEDAQAYSLDSIAKGEPQNSSATWKALWDEEYIYILVEVEDDVLNYGEDIDAWNRDAVEVFFDINNTDGSGESYKYELDPGDWQFRYNLVDKSISVGRGEPDVLTDSKDGTHIEDGTNYTVEMKFKWSELKSSLDFTASPGAELGLEVAVMDNDGEFEGALSWFANENMAHKSSLYFGTAQLVLPTETGQFNKTEAGPAIDGNSNDPMWDGAATHALAKISKDDPKNNSATWKALWDEEYVYILVEVEDDVLNYGDDIDAWNRDAVEVFFDINNTDGSGEHFKYQLDPGDWQFRYNLVDKSIAVGRGESDVATDSKDGDHIEDGTNYTVEMKFKWSELQSSLDFTPEVGAELGFEVAVMDNDGGYEGALSWNATENMAHKSSLYFGTVTLEMATGVNNINKTSNGVTVYPNPASSVLTIKNAAAGQLVSIYNITGQNVKNVKLNSFNSQISISDLKQGIYVMKVLDKEDDSSVVRFIKR